VRPPEVLEGHLMDKKSYFCQKCRQKHDYTSRIGSQHTKYISAPSRIIRRISQPTSTQNIEKTFKSSNKIVQLIGNYRKSSRKGVESSSRLRAVNTYTSSNKISHFIGSYLESYRKGVDSFGIWWTIFQVSIWSFAFIFVLLATIILVVYLPKIEMIYWEL
jgi:hypothetical protein